MVESEDVMIRQAERIITAHRQTEGGGFIVRRPLPTQGLQVVDPFLLIDEMGPADYGPGEAIGAPDHPHRGFETVTYMLEGEFEHEDSAGHRGTISSGDVQWMTAGGGIIHSEMPTQKIREQGGRLHGFQIWVNLPARLKMTQPRYQEVPGARIPEGKTDHARVKVIAGEALGAKAVIDTHTPIVYQDWQLEAGADVSQPIPADHNAVVYVFEGAAHIGEQLIVDGQMAILGAGDAVRLRAEKSARLLLLAGVPLRETVARYGPFVMNTSDEIVDAVNDFRSGRMGEINRTARVD
jgi:redox-sensitive bicupin YhaK (pirin superfamily)